MCVGEPISIHASKQRTKNCCSQKRNGDMRCASCNGPEVMEILAKLLYVKYNKYAMLE